FKMTGELPKGTTATDLVLRVTEMLRQHGVVNKFVEFFGPGLDNMPVANRATIANMAPEYGATIGFFPVDEKTLEYLRLTARDERLIQTVEMYYKEQGMWREPDRKIHYCSVLELAPGTVESSLAGPRRPQDRVSLSRMQEAWRRDLGTTLVRPVKNDARSSSEGTGGAAVATAPEVAVEHEGSSFVLRDGSVVIAAITSCT